MSSSIVQSASLTARSSAVNTPSSSRPKIEQSRASRKSASSALTCRSLPGSLIRSALISGHGGCSPGRGAGRAGVDAALDHAGLAVDDQPGRQPVVSHDADLPADRSHGLRPGLRADGGRAAQGGAQPRAHALGDRAGATDESGPLMAHSDSDTSAGAVARCRAEAGPGARRWGRDRTPTHLRYQARAVVPGSSAQAPAAE
jgi:hypothetical protein